eukprot:TCONS_00068079-protein
MSKLTHNTKNFGFEHTKITIEVNPINLMRLSRSNKIRLSQRHNYNWRFMYDPVLSQKSQISQSVRHDDLSGAMCDICIWYRGKHLTSKIDISSLRISNGFCRT